MAAEAQERRLAAKGRAAVEKKATKLEKLTVEYVGLASIKPNSYNPNSQSAHDFELLIRSMDEDGFTQPVIVHRESREIVDGEHRWTAALVCAELRRRGLMGPKRSPAPDEIAAVRADRAAALAQPGVGEVEIPAVFVDMTPEQMRIATLRHNRARGSEDVELGAQVLRDLRELGALDWAQDSLMLDDVELQRLIDDVQAPAGLAAEEFSPAWEPASAAQAASEVEAGHGPRTVSNTVAAADALRRQHEAIARAATEADRATAMRESAVCKIVLVYAGEEGELVRRALGDRPADTVLGWCRLAAERAAPAGAAP